MSLRAYCTHVLQENDDDFKINFEADSDDDIDRIVIDYEGVDIFNQTRRGTKEFRPTNRCFRHTWNLNAIVGHIILRSVPGFARIIVYDRFGRHATYTTNWGVKEYKYHLDIWAEAKIGIHGHVELFAYGGVFYPIDHIIFEWSGYSHLGIPVSGKEVIHSHLINHIKYPHATVHSEHTTCSPRYPGSATITITNGYVTRSYKLSWPILEDNSNSYFIYRGDYNNALNHTGSISLERTLKKGSYMYGDFSNDNRDYLYCEQYGFITDMYDKDVDYIFIFNEHLTPDMELYISLYGDGPQYPSGMNYIKTLRPGNFGEGKNAYRLTLDQLPSDRKVWQCCITVDTKTNRRVPKFKAITVPSQRVETLNIKDLYIDKNKTTGMKDGKYIIGTKLAIAATVESSAGLKKARIVLTGAKTSDNEWDQCSSTIEATTTATEVGDLNIQLIVTDKKGNTANKSITVNIDGDDDKIYYAYYFFGTDMYNSLNREDLNKASIKLYNKFNEHNNQVDPAGITFMLYGHHYENYTQCKDVKQTTSGLTEIKSFKAPDQKQCEYIEIELTKTDINKLKNCKGIAFGMVDQKKLTIHGAQCTIDVEYKS